MALAAASGLITATTAADLGNLAEGGERGGQPARIEVTSKASHATAMGHFLHSRQDFASNLQNGKL